MPIKIQSTKDVKVNGMKMVVYGFAGAGKTVLCSTAPRPIIISAEQGLLSLANQDIPFIEVKTVKQIGEAYNLLKDNDEYDTICIDSLSEITEVVFSEFLKSPDIIGKSGKKEPRKAYAMLAESMLPMIRNFRDLKGKHVIFTSKAKKYIDEESASVTIEPMLPGQVVPNNLPYMVDELLYMDVDRKAKRSLLCKPIRGILAKDRSGMLEQNEPPNITLLFNKILAEE